MTTEQKIIELAKLDGKELARDFFKQCSGYFGCWRAKSKDWNYTPISQYLTSYDAIIPLIQKQEYATRCLIQRELASTLWIEGVLKKPTELADALLKAKGFEV